MSTYSRQREMAVTAIPGPSYRLVTSAWIRITTRSSRTRFAASALPPGLVLRRTLTVVAAGRLNSGVSPLTMHCALCLLPKPLQDSHIIPEFLYGVMYDDKHRYNVLSLAPERRERIEQKGVREQLLSRDCEQKFSKLERYASLVLQGGAPGMDGQRNGSIVSVNGIENGRTKVCNTVTNAQLVCRLM